MIMSRNIIKNKEKKICILIEEIFAQYAAFMGNFNTNIFIKFYSMSVQPTNQHTYIYGQIVSQISNGSIITNYNGIKRNISCFQMGQNGQ